ncbi:MAG: hypothetical protein ACKVOR_02955 [Flavobacteriales bacterium]
MKNKLILAVTLALVMMAGTCKQKDTVQTETNKSGKPEEKAGADAKHKLLQININSEYIKPESTDPFSLMSQRISGDTLWLEVQYSGGCEDHIFTLNTHMHWLKTMPPQLNLYVEHDNKDDACRSLVNTQIAFDLRTIRSDGTNTIKLIIDGDMVNKLTYKY